MNRFSHHPHASWHIWQETFAIYRTFFQNAPLLAPLWLAFFPCALYALIVKPFKKSWHINCIYLGLILQGIITFVAVVALAYPPTWRYVQATIYLTLFIGWPLLLYTLCPQVYHFFSSTRRYLLLLSVMTLSVFIHNQPFSLEKGITYYPPRVACLDQIIKAHHLHNGLAGYWTMRSTTLFNRTGTTVGSLHAKKDGVAIYNWNNSKADYRHGRYDFVILQQPPHDNINQERVVAQFGPPDEKFSTAICQGNQLLYYPNQYLYTNYGQGGSQPVSYIVYVYRHHQLNRFLAQHKSEFATPTLYTLTEGNKNRIIHQWHRLWHRLRDL